MQTDCNKHRYPKISGKWDHCTLRLPIWYAASSQTQYPNSMFLSPSCKLPYDAVPGFWNAFEIRLCDTLINFNDLKLLEFGEKFYSKAAFDIVLCCHKTSSFSGMFYVDNNYFFYLFSLIYMV